MLTPYRVLDFTDERGELAGMVLGDLGADVIRIEPPEGSAARRGGLVVGKGVRAGDSIQFIAYNRNKRSVALALCEPRDRDSLISLVKSAHVIFESFPEGELERHGIGFDTLREWNPDIVLVRISAFGVDGPHAGHAASDLTIAAMSGSVSVQGTPTRAPVRVSTPQSWRHAGAWGATAAMIALAAVARGSGAQYVDVSAPAAMTWTMLDQVAAAAHGLPRRERIGSSFAHAGVTYQSVFPCRDGYATLSPGSSEMDPLIDWLVEEELLVASYREKDFAAPFEIPREGQENFPLALLLEKGAELVARYDREELMQAYIERGVRTAPLNGPRELLGFHHLAEREYWITQSLGEAQEARAPGPFVRSSRFAFSRQCPAPRIGEHTETIGQSSPTTAERRQGARAGLPFHDVRIADFTWAVAGPTTTKILADQGAEVIRIESFSRPDVLRWLPPYLDDIEGADRSYAWAQWNTGKRSIALNLKTEGGAALARRLITWANVVVENFSPGTMDRLGLGYDTVQAINPRAVMLSSTLMGQPGCGAHIGGWGNQAASIAGFYEFTGWPDLPPDGPYFAHTDVIAPMFGACALMAAIDHQRRTGKGQYLDASQLEAALHFLAPELLAHQTNKTTFPRLGNRHLLDAPQGIYPCHGEPAWCAIAIDTDAQWRCLREVLGAPPWSAEPSLDTAAGRQQRHDEIDRHLTGWTRELPAREVMDWLQKAGVPCGVVQGTDDLKDDPQYRHRQFFHTHRHTLHGEAWYAAYPFHIQGEPQKTRFAAPCIGEHSTEVMRDVLGMDTSEIEQAQRDGAVETDPDQW